jgi:phosphate transport system permease protein
MSSVANTRAGVLLSTEAVRGRLASRHARERRFKWVCATALWVAIGFLGLLFATLLGRGIGAFTETQISIDVYLDPAILDPTGERAPETLAQANYAALVRNALIEHFPEVAEDRSARRDLADLVSAGAAYRIQDEVTANPGSVGLRRVFWVPAADDVDLLAKGVIPRDVPEEERRVADDQIAWFDALAEKGLVRRSFNWTFLTSGDSREPELAGLWAALKGSIYTMLVTLVMSFPLGVSAAVYLQEFAPKNRWTDLIEININNLAAVPSIVFGLLGLAVFLNFFQLPRSAPLVGGLVLSLMTLPTIIIASRIALQTVPPSIREAAYGLGASPTQVIAHHVLPLALPGILTGTILGMARALGETAPLLMIGMVAFIVDVPQGLTDPSTVLPVQIYLWADSPERAFVAKTSGAILVLLAFLVLMNGTAVWLRRRTERKG